MLRKDNLVPGEIYHLYNRGVDKRDIFLNDSDYKRFIGLLYQSNTNAPINSRDNARTSKDFSSIFSEKNDDQLVSIGAYCLMPNHFHILVKEKVEGGITTFMKKLSTAYVMYFNPKYERNGALFQGRFKSIHAGDDRYLKYLYSYIHLNPMKLVDEGWNDRKLQNKKRSIQFIRDYPYSSYPDYLEERKQSVILDKKEFPEYFTTKQDIDGMINDWLAKDGPL